MHAHTPAYIRVPTFIHWAMMWPIDIIEYQPSTRRLPAEKRTINTVTDASDVSPCALVDVFHSFRMLYTQAY